ncbi:S-adenosyl-L-methionine:benzoic acid/salicylic acid carboxyl methyltransferase 3-like [Vicia villosa]|uniref:S-adenosyl-L-methionine:benzoic acid/salicylic acid carboxyl methyltransferase 3-like n=1 Tax=Vicia villosa TaxID=3911 RepID=UPI00273C7997|nr:S-adenosyl-L-methionine:benzoic acid/salicylic acid carboxyl methyltransferase 3-like [Vicia villosa]
MDLKQVIHMKGGDGKEGYANNSLLQRKVISLTRSLRDEAITDVYRNTNPESLGIADLGCSYGANTFLVIAEAIKAVEKFCQEQKQKSPEYKVYLNDLPGNDFNNVFRSFDAFKKNLVAEVKNQMCPLYFFGAPGSFYDRLFPNKSLHFVHSSYSLQFLSKVPDGVDINKGNVYLNKTSPPDVLKAYIEQYKSDLSFFLKCRAEELVEGGRLVVTLIGRIGEDPIYKECCLVWDVMSMGLNDMVKEGIIKEESMSSFNIPLYYPSQAEVKKEIDTQGSFDINYLETSEVNLSELDNWDVKDDGYSVENCFRAVAEPMLTGHFGESVTKEAFSRFMKNAVDHMPKDKAKISNITMSLTRKP